MHRSSNGAPIGRSESIAERAAAIDGGSSSIG
jgi:hypothetical protein